MLHHETTIISSIAAFLSVGLTGIVVAVQAFWNRKR
jgi:hypothetical protein